MKEKIFLFALLLLLVIPFASAVPPVTQTIQVGGLDIAYPQYQYVKIGSAFTLYIHVYNTTQYIKGGTASCYLDLYNPQGEETMSQLMTAGSSDYYVPITAGNFSMFGVNSFIIQCNTTSQVGFANGVFEVNPTGLEYTIQRAITYGLLLVLFLIMMGLCIVGGIAMPGSNSRDMAGYIIAVSNVKYVKIGCWFVAYLLMLIISYFTWQLSYAFLGIQVLGNILRLIFVTMTVASFPLFIITCYILIANWVRDNKIANSLMNGLRIK